YSSKQAKQAFIWQLVVFGVGYAGAIASYVIFIASFFSDVSSFAVDPTDPNNPINPQFPFGSFIALFVFYGFITLLSLSNLVGSVIAATQVAEGKPFHYPLLGRL